ncbi:MAG: hypothetical protein ABW321_25130 [Polyangiales bacterium]
MGNAAGSLRHLDTDARQRLAQILLRRGVRQLGVLRATSAGIARAPTIDDCAGSIERAREELLHLERAADLYAEVTGADLLVDAEQTIGELPHPESWVEALLAQLMLCLAARVELESATEFQVELEPNTRRMLARRAEQVNAARAALHEARATCELRDALHAGTTRWLTVVLGTLEDDGTRQRYTRELERTVEPISVALRH